MVPLISIAAGSHRGLQTSTSSRRQRDADNLVDVDEDITVSLTIGRVPVGHGSSSHH